MMRTLSLRSGFFLCILLLAQGPLVGQESRPDPVKNPNSPIALDLPGTNQDPTKIDYAKLPVLKGTHAVVSPADPQWKFQLHNYLIHFQGRFWCMWSHGPAEDEPPQHIRYATSEDGLKWTESKVLVAPDKEGYACIARAFWLREGELLALFAHFKGKGAFGVNKELELRAMVWDATANTWKRKGLVYENAINSFQPEKLSTGEWMLTRRDSRFNTSMLIGGVKSLSDWRSVPIVGSLQIKGFRPDEPHWYEVPGGLSALFRDNGGSSRLYRAFSTDQGATWTTPVLTNFPNATSKFYSIRLSKGFRAMAINANPTVGRRQMYLALSRDGLVYSRLLLLDIPTPRPSTLQYPHLMEHDGSLWIAFSRLKATIELLKISLEDLQPFMPADQSKK